MIERDTSAIFHKSMLDDEHAALVPDATPWVFECDNGAIAYKTEDNAAAAQREWRIALGFNPITGERERPVMYPAKDYPL